VAVDETDLAIDKLESYISRSQAVLVLCSRYYFASANCMRELRAAARLGKPLIALLEDQDRDTALTRDQVHTQLTHGCEGADGRWASTLERCAQWGLGERPPLERLWAVLTAHELLEWSRLPIFQDVTLRLVAERLLPSELTGHVYTQGEGRDAVALPALSRGSCHAFASPENGGAAQLLLEVGRVCASEPALRACADVNMLPNCRCMLLLLNRDTWVSPERSAALAADVEAAMAAGVKLVLAHEMRGLCGQEQRGGVPFSTFFERDQTPRELIRRGIYHDAAVPLKGGPWRAASLRALAVALSKSGPKQAGLRWAAGGVVTPGQLPPPAGSDDGDGGGAKTGEVPPAGPRVRSAGARLERSLPTKRESSAERPTLRRESSANLEKHLQASSTRSHPGRARDGQSSGRHVGSEPCDADAAEKEPSAIGKRASREESRMSVGAVNAMVAPPPFAAALPLAAAVATEEQLEALSEAQAKKLILSLQSELAQVRAEKETALAQVKAEEEAQRVASADETRSLLVA
jgi:hypothetical protein